LVYPPKQKLLEARWQKEEPMRAEGAELTRHSLQVPLQGLVLGLASVVLCEQLLEDVGLKLVDTLKDREGTISASTRISSEPAVVIATPKLRGL
jgi:hypothetical protein